jgi:endoglycosylceramidase
MASSSAIGRWYDNYNGVLDKFSNFWGKVAFEFKDSKFVVGYELMNEPFVGDIYPNILKVIIPAYASRYVL